MRDAFSAPPLRRAGDSERHWQTIEALGQPGSAVWHVDLTRASSFSGEQYAWLSPDERARAASFRRPDDHDRFVASHLALRHILSRYLGRSPDALRFRTDPGGKPELDGSDRASLRFNLSHSGQHALIGITDGAAIGADVEAIRPIGDPMAIARAHFHPGEIADLLCLPQDRRGAAFFACWTAKEAVAKALGTGLLMPLDSFRVSVPPASAALLGWEHAADRDRDWTMHALHPGPDAIGTVAIARAEEPCTRYRLAPSWADAT